MNHMYYILGTAGWIWFAVVMLYLLVRLAIERRRVPARGFDVLRTQDVPQGGPAAKDVR
jgi:hypothetical protein